MTPANEPLLEPHPTLHCPQCGEPVQYGDPTVVEYAAEPCDFCQAADDA